jgi:folate-binding protein YgfZ
MSGQQMIDVPDFDCDFFTDRLYDAGMTPLTYLSLLKVSGADATKFLQAQLTAHLAGLKPPAATFSAYCTPKGQVVATLLVAPQDDHWLLVVESTLREVLLRRLQTFILRDDVRIEPVNSHGLFVEDPSDFRVDSLILLEPRSLPLQYAVSGIKSVPNPEAMARWRRQELISGIAWLNQPTSEKFIPQMLGLDAIGAVSFTKGCYPGQEIIARARHLGEVKRRPQVLDIEGEQPPDLNLPCVIYTSTGQAEASMIHCVGLGFGEFTILAVAALQPGEEVRMLQQDGQRWFARRALRDPQY